jgi:hypothetical protein
VAITHLAPGVGFRCIMVMWGNCSKSSKIRNIINNNISNLNVAEDVYNDNNGDNIIIATLLVVVMTVIALGLICVFHSK